MKVEPTILSGCLILTNPVHRDERGSFQETFNERDFRKATGLQVHFVQDNLSFSKKGVLRGLHFQSEPFGQEKLVRVIAGEVLDVVVDLRAESPSFGKHVKLRLNSDEGKSVFIPKGMAHGFLTISETAIFSYKCDRYYNPQFEVGIRYDDPDLAIDWGTPSSEVLLSEKDKKAPFLTEANLKNKP